MSTRTASRLAWSAFAVAAFLGVAVIVLGTLNTQFNPISVIAAIDLLLFSFVGAIVASRQPRNLIGWILVGWGLSVIFLTAAVNYVQGQQRPGAVLVAALTGPMWNPVVEVAIVLVPLLFPAGRLLSPRWRFVVWCAVAFVVMAVPANALMPGSLTKQGTGPQNPIGIASAKDLLTTIINLSLIPGAVALGGAVASLVVRYRRAGSQERHQLKWFLFGCAFLMAGFGTLSAVPGPITAIFVAAGLTTLPLSIGFAILKYRLYEIDVVINKSLVYGALAVFITAIYVVIVVGIGTLFGSGGKPNLGLSIVATAIVAVAFQPVRERVQQLANQLVYGKRATPYEVMADFASHMSGVLSSDEVLPKIAEAAATGVGARAARIILLLVNGQERVVSWPNPLPELTPKGAGVDFNCLLPVSYRGQRIGELAIAKPLGEAIIPAEEKLLSDLTSQAGLVLHNVRLAVELQGRLAEISSQAAELRASRQRLVSAQDAERQRLEQTIRDGAEQELAAIESELCSLPEVLVRYPDGGIAILERLTQRADATLEGLRDLARGVYPPLLRDQGLAAALDAQARKMGEAITLETDGLSRYPSEVEAAVYFCCVEGIRHRTGPSRIRIADRDGRLQFSISSARLYAGLFQQLEDRIEALGGRLRTERETLVGSVPVDQLRFAASQAATSRSGSNFDFAM